MSRWGYGDVPDLTGRRALVTGANSGIGAVEARVLAQHGADVVLAARRPDAAREVADRIRASGAPGAVEVEELDLASLDSVRALARRLEGPLDLLVNNAGVMAPPRRRETADGFELQFGTNHLGHFALTGLLLPRLLESAAPRVATVSSLAHFSSDGRVAEGNPPDDYDPQTSYGRSKLANLLFATELHRRTQVPGSPLASLTSTAAHPGVSNTRLFTSRDGMGALAVVRALGPVVGKVAFSSPERGAEAVVNAATVARPGAYVGPTWLGGWRGPVGEVGRSPWGADEALGRLLWDRSEDLTGVSFPG
ncbi:SDR family NAD(P)-dependent oxidoreductase [Oryzobacter telluris]|uniref:SDR family NAD(P)-dependent oxidoreductase n=1 Tax=Oryzobacter telluris TaxID=3149179 RepID=UPI00370D537D